MQTSTAGYSKTPLARKLGIKEGYKLLFHDLPEYYFDLFDQLPKDLMVMADKRADSADFIHLFFTKQDDFEKMVPGFIPSLKKNGSMWVSWPKGKSKITSDLNRDLIREHILGLGLVDVKVAAIDDDWSGLKFMYRVKDR